MPSAHLGRASSLRALPPVAAGAPVCLAVAVALSGCSSAVQVQPFERSDSRACLAVAEQWPATVGDLPRRVTAADSEGVAAWGDPAVIARCGATPPLPTTDQCLDISGVDWVARELSDGYRFTTYGRDPAIEVLVPARYAPGSLLLPAFGEAARVIPQGAQRCT